ncbi:MAG: NCS2 family permease [Methanobrevibacter sp.]|uniref:NCS2 family permease n=1 Tax=Methanobrevibacter sp. TaxID=66852 RepID=UPI0025E5535A|nr:NCS2 family permease [Methanobrevibacter sp.]MBR3114089.1 NCS2 family permease [Methanobrevibacter sp.]MBR6993098.1 NCS2 family permease [Methanobrevibacter sp.]
MLDNFFKFTENGTDFKTEILAGITTFLAMAYILGVNPIILSDGGMPATGVFFATAIASGVASIIMGLVAKYPVGLAPGMGLNALFTYTIILGMGNTWETALAAVFISSIIFLLITISGLREAILNAIPLDLKLGIGAAIGFFLAFLGLKGAGIIVADPSTFVTMGSLLSAPALLALIGIVITLILYVRKVPAAVFIGLVVTAIIGVIFTLCGFGAGDMLMPAIPAQFISADFDLSLFAGFMKGFGQLFSNIPNLIMMLFSLVFVTFFDTTGTLMALGRQCGFIDEEGQAVGIQNAFLADAVGGIVGAIFGTSTVTAYVESATGIGLGGKTGLTAIVTGILFILSIFFAPLVLSLFTSPVTCAALVIVGILMIAQLQEVEWGNLIVAASVFMTIIMMILTYSISLGIAWGFVVYAIASLASGKAKELGWGIWLMVIVFVIYLFFGL